MSVRIATFNIYWFPSSSFIGNRRSKADQRMIREVIHQLDADIIIFQEILDLAALEDLLSAFAPTRSYCLRDETGHWVASGAEKKNDMKVPLAFDSAKLEIIEAGTVRRPGEPTAPKRRRDPVAARLRLRGGGPTFTVLGVHLKSGILTTGPGPSTKDDEIRIQEMADLTVWITNLTPITPGGPPRPVGEPTMLIGDFNAVRGNAALTSLAPGGALSSWSWPEPRFTSAMVPLPVEADLQAEERWTTHLDRKILDHVIISPEVRVVDGPWVYAFDRDGAWLEAVGVSADWFEEKSYKLTPEQDPSMTVENLHRVSDHRPVWASVALD